MKTKKKACGCTDPGCYNCLVCSFTTTLHRAALRAKKHKPTYQPKPKKKKKKEPPAKCDVCRRKLIPGDGKFCMTCQYRMEHDSR